MKLQQLLLKTESMRQWSCAPVALVIDARRKDRREALAFRGLLKKLPRTSTHICKLLSERPRARIVATAAASAGATVGTATARSGA